MPFLAGFSNNPLITRDDVVRASLALLRPLHAHFSPRKARIKLPVATAAHFDETAAQLEGFARPLWAVASLLRGLDESVEDDGLRSEILEVVEPWVIGLPEGCNPESPEYWGEISHTDQRMVEAEIVSFALIAAPSFFWTPLDDSQKSNVRAWLLGMNGKDMPKTNWLWFRIMSNLALVETCGVPKRDVWDQVESDMDMLDRFDRGDGWSSDGYWLTEDMAKEEAEEAERIGQRDTVGLGRQADYYSGSFAIQFSQLVYVRFANGADPKRCEIFKERARKFGLDFWRYFDTNGSSIPFGRSLTYRFACGAFFSTLALAKVDKMPIPISTDGDTKGFLLRHLRWWASNSLDFLALDGTLTIGWLYPNMYMSEDYNSPQSPYWCMKAFAALCLPAKDEFWATEECSYPLRDKTQNHVHVVSGPQQILCNHPGGNHHFLLSPGQFVGWPMKATQAKYCKFAYSSAFGFSVPTGPLIQQLAPDSALYISRDGGETWATKWKCGPVRISDSLLMVRRNGVMLSYPVPTAVVDWHPWGDGQVQIKTTLIPPTDRWSDWHVRIHRIKFQRLNYPPQSIRVVEGGFAIPGRRKTDGMSLAALAEVPVDAVLGEAEGILERESSALVLSYGGASGVRFAVQSAEGLITRGMALKPDSNTNLVCQRTLIPIARVDLLSKAPDGFEITLVQKVFAISAMEKSGTDVSGSEEKTVNGRWEDAPVVRVGGDLVAGDDVDCMICIGDSP